MMLVRERMRRARRSCLPAAGAGLPAPQPPPAPLGWARCNGNESHKFPFMMLLDSPLEASSSASDTQKCPPGSL